MKRWFAAVLLIMAVPAFAELQIGSKVPGFSLMNTVDGKNYDLKPGDGKVAVLVFTCNQCPYAKAFERRLIDIANAYDEKGVVFYAINPNDDRRYEVESAENMKSRAVERNYPFPYLKDADSSVAKAYDARVTPHVYVVDGNGNLRYRGYIDDSAKPEQRTRTGLTDALDAVLSNGEVPTQITREFGCTIKWKS